MINILYVYAIISTWLVLIINIILAFSGYYYYGNLMDEIEIDEDEMDYPFVSILIPAHNEGKVIRKTLESVLLLDYPRDRVEVIVINDNSSDDSREILEGIRDENPHANITIINTDAITGGKGKSNALNIGYNQSRGDYLVIYDADNTPERASLKYLVTTIVADDKLGAVIGKFRTRNKNVNLLTKFINIETLCFQWMIQAGRWQLLQLCTIPGTNFIIRKEIIEMIGGWDDKAIAEDTEISFRIYRMGYKIKFMPYAVTWEQEPQTLKIWLKQRTRWAKGNIYVLFKYVGKIFTGGLNIVIADIIYFFAVYFMFLSSVVLSDIIFILGIFTKYKITLTGNFTLLWIFAYVLFVLQVAITLTMEKGESNLENTFLICIMYFSYCQLWIVVAAIGLVEHVIDIVLKRKVRWYKTERF